jgi:hypothetical protein
LYDVFKENVFDVKGCTVLFIFILQILKRRKLSLCFIGYAQSQNFRAPNIASVFGRASKSKDINRITDIGYDNLCMREENLSFDNNDIFGEL